ncbi:hypothetical protein [Caldisalinibacter kiritimatiensis]|uniref:Uncharacterized protein n=1 Tax=Caldisalinibacter kiritimatiensis TaxID=1304284 RepID=R1CD32_9FIRM|nr:hypothetical protein [Caldisalinibacter kiritimatiensis]EOD00205.1 hypothetical protein L21TH_1750 [Caldisalinibacter kiritimatiensis]
MDLNYFSILCFFWAFVGILTRILIVALGDKWKEWEINKAYAKERPKWLNYIGIFGFALVIFTWYKVFTTNVGFSWIIAVLLSLTLIKLYKLTFDYNEFREFVINVFEDKTN